MAITQINKLIRRGYVGDYRSALYLADNLDDKVRVINHFLRNSDSNGAHYFSILSEEEDMEGLISHLAKYYKDIAGMVLRDWFISIRERLNEEHKEFFKNINLLIAK